MKDLVVDVFADLKLVNDQEIWQGRRERQVRRDAKIFLGEWKMPDVWRTRLIAYVAILEVVSECPKLKWVSTQEAESFSN